MNFNLQLFGELRLLLVSGLVLQLVLLAPLHLVVQLVPDLTELVLLLRQLLLLLRHF